MKVVCLESHVEKVPYGMDGRGLRVYFLRADGGGLVVRDVVWCGGGWGVG